MLGMIISYRCFSYPFKQLPCCIAL